MPRRRTARTRSAPATLARHRQLHAGPAPAAPGTALRPLDQPQGAESPSSRETPARRDRRSGTGPGAGLAAAGQRVRLGTRVWSGCGWSRPRRARAALRGRRSTCPRRGRRGDGRPHVTQTRGQPDASARSPRHPPAPASPARHRPRSTPHRIGEASQPGQQVRRATKPARPSSRAAASPAAPCSKAPATAASCGGRPCAPGPRSRRPARRPCRQWPCRDCRRRPPRSVPLPTQRGCLHLQHHGAAEPRPATQRRRRSGRAGPSRYRRRAGARPRRVRGGDVAFGQGPLAGGEQVPGHPHRPRAASRPSTTASSPWPHGPAPKAGIATVITSAAPRSAAGRRRPTACAITSGGAPARPAHARRGWPRWRARHRTCQRGFRGHQDRAATAGIAMPMHTWPLRPVRVRGRNGKETGQGIRAPRPARRARCRRTPPPAGRG